MSKKANIFFLLIFLFINNGIKGQSIKINGKLFDKDQGKMISNGVIFLNPGNQVTTTDTKGEFSFTSSPGRKLISTKVLGYFSANIWFEASFDTVINIYVQVSPYELSEAIIIGDSIKNVVITHIGSFILTTAAIRETPKLFSEPDLLKLIQIMPGVVPGKDGSSDIYVRGGSRGQNVFLANGCYFFLPAHLLGFVSPFDLDFLESAELYKDYFPSELGSGASSVINLDFRKSRTDSLKAQLRLGLLSSGMTVELPLNDINWDLTAGIRRSNYSLYAPLLKKIVSSEIVENLPPDNYSFYDGYLQLFHNSEKWGKIRYLFFGNYDRGKEEYEIKSQAGDTLIHHKDGMMTGWNNMVHALQWYLPSGNKLKWRIDLNYNRISMKRELYMQTDKFLNTTDDIFESSEVSYLISPTINSIGSTIIMSRENARFSYSAGISNRLRLFLPNIIAASVLNDTITENLFGDNQTIYEPAAFISSSLILTTKLQLDAGIRLSGAITRDAMFFVPEPRIRLAYNQGGIISPHINFVRLSQTDHSVEGSNAGLRIMLWLPVSRDFSPEVSDIFSAGFQGQIDNNLVWTVDAYHKKISGMVDFSPGASFIFDTSFEDLLDKIRGRAYGLEAGIIKRKGKLTGSTSYTYSRAEREWSSPNGMIWIPSNADRPHNINLTMKYRLNEKTSFGFNWVFVSGSPATIYMHNTSYGEWFETKNNIRYFDYHRLDLSFRYIVYIRKFSILIDADIYNVYNRKNTYYFREVYDENENEYYYKNISLFPVMPSVTVTIKY
ncbi:MAG: TonB-dependent receptor plug domain-containing protein [Bacteroidetes bacterium]|nr:TonB-dependent receptor plug domain-containing protein [Bacteroidota bacterium]